MAILDPKTHFVMVYTSGGGPRFLGTMDKVDIDGWKSGSQKVVELRYPKLYGEMGDQQGQIHQIIQNLHISNSPQEEIFVFPFVLEVLGSVNMDGGVWFCKNTSKLWSAYIEKVREWVAACSGIIAPSPVDISRIRKLADIRKK
jgi:hypothetical protein